MINASAITSDGGDTYVDQLFKTGNIDGSRSAFSINPHGVEDFFQRALQVALHLRQFFHYEFAHRREQCQRGPRGALSAAGRDSHRMWNWVL